MTEAKSSMSHRPLVKSMLRRLTRWMAKKLDVSLDLTENEDGTASLRLKDADNPARYVEFCDLMDDDQRVIVRIVIPDGDVSVNAAIQVETGDIFGGLD